MENRIKQIVSQGLKNIKPFSDYVQKVIKFIESGESDTHILANIIKQGPVLSVRILSLANSPFYGLNRKVESIETACVILGFNIIKNIVVSTGALDSFPVTDQRIKIWIHSAEVAAISELVAKKLGQPESTLYIAGLLHDIGKFLLVDIFPEYKSLIESCSYIEGEKSLDDETKVMGVNHAQVSAMILAYWNLPEEIHDIVEKHHMPGDARNSVMCNILNLSDKISHELDKNKLDEEIISDLNQENIQSAGLEINELNSLLPEIRKKIESVRCIISSY